MADAARPGVPGETSPVELTTGPNPTASIIWLHGLGADGHDFEPAIPQLAARLSRATRFILPHAPYRPVTINDGHVMRAWYDMGWSERGYVQNVSQIAESAESVRQMIMAEQHRGIRADRIVVGGFSQGGVLALSAGLSHWEPLAGIVALSAPVHDVAQVLNGAHPAQARTRIFLAHGSHDSMVPVALGRAAGKSLAAAEYPVQWAEYPMDHSVCTEELAAIAVFLAELLN